MSEFLEVNVYTKGTTIFLGQNRQRVKATGSLINRIVSEVVYSFLDTVHSFRLVEFFKSTNTVLEFAEQTANVLQTNLITDPIQDCLN